MAHKTWFLPPHFSFLPDGELSLGTVIAHPSKPTRILGSLGEEHPEIILPQVSTITEPGHRHSAGSGRQLGGDFFAKVVDLASVTGSASWSRTKIKSLGTVDLEVRTFERPLSGNSLQKIVELGPVKRHMKQSLLGNRPFYIVTGLRVAKEPFDVLFEKTTITSASLGVSGPVPAGPIPVKMGAEASVSRERSRVVGYTTAPGIVYAYQLHVVRPKRDGNVTTELFSHRTGFMSREVEDNLEGETLELECLGVDAEELGDDEELEVEFEEHSMGDNRETCILFKEDS